MQELIMFYFPECPYCKQAFKWHEELLEEHPEFEKVSLRLIDEHKEPRLADSYDYWYVPCYFLGDEKLAEGVKDKALIEAAFRRALGEESEKKSENGAIKRAKWLKFPLLRCIIDHKHLSRGGKE